MRIRLIALCLVMLTALVQARSPPEITEDGLVRVPSSGKVGVYRAPDIPFTQYRRISLGSVPIAFSKSWLRANKNMKEADRERIRSELATLYREELVHELVERGGFALTDETTPDVLRVVPSISELEISAPDAGMTPGTRSFVHTAGSMKLVIELHDAASGVLVARIIDIEHARELHQLQLVDQVSNADEARVAFANAARHTREALNVARTERPR